LEEKFRKLFYYGGFYMGMWDQQFYSQSWKEMNRLLNEMTAIFENPFAGKQHRHGTKNEEFPLVNLYASPDTVILKAELPGMNADDINIQILEDSISIQGERKILNAEKEAVYHRQERPCGKFSRAFKLPFAVENEKVEAKYENGILEITLPRSEKDKPKQVKVKIS
jgi:HSP20 family protein